MSFPKYPAYKDSGVEWLGEVPEHWVVKKLKREIIAQSGIDQKCDGGDFPLFGANGVIGETNTASVQGACVLIGRVGSAGEINFISQAAGVSDNALIVSNQIFNTPRYDFYLFHAIDIKSSISRNAQPLITASGFRDRIVAVPMDVCERLQITRFLDHETARIDALIEEQQHLIELLKEKRQTEISHAVTKGLDPSVPMKDSGVEWLGEVPAHWEVKRLKHLCADIKAGPFGSALTKDMYVGAGYKVYGQEQVIPCDFNLGGYYIDEERFCSLRQYSVLPGDILISCVGTFGKVAVVPEEVEAGIINPRLIRVRTNDRVSPKYLFSVLRSSVVFEQFSLLSRGGLWM